MSKIVAEIKFVYRGGEEMGSKAKENIQRKKEAKSKRAAETEEQRKKISDARNKKDRARRLAKMTEASYSTVNIDFGKRPL